MTLNMKVKVITTLNLNISKTNGLIPTKFDGQLTYHIKISRLNFEGQGSKVKLLKTGKLMKVHITMLKEDTIQHSRRGFALSE